MLDKETVMLFKIPLGDVVKKDHEEIVANLEREYNVKLKPTKTELDHLLAYQRKRRWIWRSAGGWKREKMLKSTPDFQWRVNDVVNFFNSMLIENRRLRKRISEMRAAKRALQNRANASKTRSATVGKTGERKRMKKANLTRKKQSESPTKTLRHVVRAGVSFRQYEHLRGSSMPSRTKLIEKDKQLRLDAEKNSGLLDRSPNSSQIPLISACKRALHGLIESDVPEKLWFKISGDGTYCRKVGFVNLTVELIRPLPVKRSAVVLACVKGSEDAETPDLVAALRQIDSEMQSLNDVNGIPTQFYLGADLKFIWMVLGLAGGLSDYPCPYCTVHRTKKHIERGEERSITTMVDIGGQVKKSKLKSSSRQGMKGPPLLTQIPISRVIADEMHMILRVFDRIFMKMKVQLAKEGKLAELEAHMEAILKRKVKITENMLISTRLNLKDRELLLDQFDMGLPVEECGRRFMRLIRSVREMCRSGDVNRETLERMCRDWRSHYLSVCQDSDFTPYMHILCFHLPDLMCDTDAFFHHFNQQLVEKANAQLRKDAERYKYSPHSLILQSVKRDMLC